MTMTLTFTGDWADIRREMRSVLGLMPTDFQITYDGQNAAEPVASEPPAPRTRRKKAEVPVAQQEGASDWVPSHWTATMAVESEAPEPVYESTATTPLVEESAPSVDAPAETQAFTSEAGSDAPASGTATPASEVAYADVVAAVTDLARAKGPDAVKQALGEMGLTTAKGTSPDVWPAIINAMRAASEIAL